MMMMKKITFMLLVLAFIPFAYSQTGKDGSTTLSGKGVIWSPTMNAFLYGSVGKSSGSIVWRLYTMSDGAEETLFFGKNISPVWSYDGNYIAFQDTSILKVSDSQRNVTEFKTPVSAIDSIVWSPDSLKILYSGDGQIYLYDIASKNNSQVTFGRRPYYLPGDRGLLYMDDEFSVYFMDPAGERDILLSDIDDFAVSSDGNTYAFYNGQGNRIILMKMPDKNTNSFSVSGPVQGLSFDSKGKYLAYGIEGQGVEVYNLIVNKSSKILDEGFFPSFSMNDDYVSYELPKDVIKVIPFENISSKLPSSKFYKIGVGSANSIKKGDIFQVYEEKINPFNNSVVGFDPTKLKGKARVVSLSDSYALLEKVGETSDFEINDAIVTVDGIFKAGITGIEK